MKQHRIYLTVAIGTVLFSLFFFSSCKVGKEYKRIETNLPERFDEPFQDTLTIADLQWWQIYEDTTLQNLIRQTLEYNKDLKIAAARVKELAHAKRIDFSKMWPQIGADMYAKKSAEDYGGDNFKNKPEFALRGLVTWEFDLWGNLRWGWTEGVAEYMSSIESHRALKMSIVAQVAESYFELVALDHELAIVRQTLKAREEGVRLARIRYEGGLTSETSYLQAKLEYARTATLVPDLERKITIKENDILFLAGEYPREIERVVMPEDVKLPESLPIGLPSTLLERRPDVRSAEQQLIAANAAVGIAYTNMFPKLSLTAKFGFENSSLVDFFRSPMHELAASLLAPLFNFNKNRAAWRAKEAAYEAECYRYEKTVMGAFYDARNAIVNFNKIKEIYESRSELERSSKATMELAQLQYLNGVIGYLDVLDAQRSYFDAQISLSNALRDKQITMVRLYKALGGGWQ